MCPHCGNLRSICSDPSIDWHPQASYCYATASVEWGRRRLQNKHPSADEKSGVHPLDGLSVWVTDVELDDEGAFDLGPTRSSDEQQQNPSD